MNYAESLTYLTDLGYELRGVKFDLRAIESVLAELGAPHQKYPTAIVAGTNGKGSTAAILASILQCAGYRTGLYTSPHLIRVNERIRVDSREIADEDFARCFTDVRQAVERLLERKALDLRPSFFEHLTAIAFLHFARTPVDFAVLEVGLGGRLDATNVTAPRVAIVTNVEIDHVEFLGATHAAIAREKAGVIKPHRPVVSASEHPEVVEVLRQRAAELDAELIELPRLALISNVQGRGGLYRFNLAVNGDCFTGLSPSLRGKFQVQNAATAVSAAWRLSQDGWNIPRAAIVEGVRRARWEGRLEVILDHPLVVVDGAHNPAAAREVAAFARENWAGKRLRLVYASMRDKAIGEISEILFPRAEEVYLTRPELTRAATAEQILAAARIQPQRVVIEPDPARALERACRASAPDDVVLACGSLFLVGALKKAQLEGRLRVEAPAERVISYQLSALSSQQEKSGSC
jgi:dihydrofolate synthase/folylpolyglutamate synthase